MPPNDVLSVQAQEARQRMLSIQAASNRDVAEAELILADEALKEFRHGSGFGDAIDALNENPLPHTIVVNRAGKRFGNEAFYRSFYYTIDIIDGATQTHPNFPCWAVIDS